MRILALMVLGLLAGCSSEDTSGSTGDSSDGCIKAGGQCNCGCEGGFVLADPPLRDACPQPCDQCGACSPQCCMPAPPTDGGADAGDAS